MSTVIVLWWMGKVDMASKVDTSEEICLWKCGFLYGFPEGDKQDLNHHPVQLLDFRNEEA